MALSVGERKHEIGVRLALGATPRRVIGSHDGTGSDADRGRTGCGICRRLGDVDFYVASCSSASAADSVTFAASLACWWPCGLTSSFVPLTRIAKLDPVVLLKADNDAPQEVSC